MTYRSGGPPHAYPKGLHGCYRGRLVRNPRLIERPERPPMATGRIAVHMAAPNTPREDRDALTEYVNVLAFDERCRHLLMNCSSGQLVAIVGGVTLETYKGRDGKKKIGRTIRRASSRKGRTPRTWTTASRTASALQLSTRSPKKPIPHTANHRPSTDGEGPPGEERSPAQPPPPVTGSSATAATPQQKPGRGRPTKRSNQKE